MLGITDKVIASAGTNSANSIKLWDTNVEIVEERKQYEKTLSYREEGMLKEKWNLIGHKGSVLAMELLQYN